MLENIKALILDMDGVLWQDTTPIGDLPAIFDRMKELGLKVAFATNNASSTKDEFIDKFGKLNVRVEPWQIVTSSLATARRLAMDFPEGGTIFVIGQNGIQQALKRKGFTVITNPDDQSPVTAVASGIDFSINYSKLRRATMHIRGGAAFYGANPDKTYPTPEGLVPGAGSILAAIEAATDVKPIIVGKPQPAIMHMALERLGTRPGETLVVGDRIETDIAAGQAAGCKTALVLSGVTTREQAKDWQPPTDMVLEDLSELIMTNWR